MMGFEIKINNEEAINVASDSLVSILMGIGYDRIDNYLSVKGIDSKSYCLDWYDRELQIGDKIHVRIKEIGNISPLKARRPLDRDDMKKSYYTLKQELEDKGLV
ncbi:MAG: hypothetical protein LBR65_05570 [Culturomica sp.]|jgi:hypothetical protein|nr:hypothetical protein [Culturomica sp.]